MLKNGMIWRVGNGRSIRIWADPWLPREWTRRPITPRGSNLLTTVDELIDPSTGKLDEPLVEQTFFEEDAKLILSLPSILNLMMLLPGIMISKGSSHYGQLTRCRGIDTVL